MVLFSVFIKHVIFVLLFHVYVLWTSSIYWDSDVLIFSRVVLVLSHYFLFIFSSLFVEVVEFLIQLFFHSLSLPPSLSRIFLTK